MKRKNIVVILVIFILSFLAFFPIFLNKYFNFHSFDELIFHIKVPAEGANLTYVRIMIFFSLTLTICTTVILSVLFLYPFKKEIKIGKTVLFPICKWNFKLKITFTLLFSVLIFYNFFIKLKMDVYAKNLLSSSTLIEDEYVEPSKEILSFPEKKRNLIYIFLESMEASYMTEKNGGNEKREVIPYLETLATDNVSFSNTNKLGGALPITGTTWTMGAIVGHTTGLPLKIYVGNNNYGKYETFLPGVVSLGDLLEEEGYEQVFLLGSDATFGGRRKYFESHGNYKIWDWKQALQEGKKHFEDYVWWGYEDKDLFTYAKEQLQILSKQDKPFNFTMLTVDTHFEGGYLSETCDTPFDHHYANVLHCNDQMLMEFINWIQNQDFYENTTVILVGDHLSMDQGYFKEVKQTRERTIYNVILNSPIPYQKNKNRTFTVLDFFPTTLASLNVEIKGNRLGLGTNLFSSEETLPEKYGYDTFQKELEKKSIFYESKFLYRN